MSDFRPYADDDSVLTIGGLSVENGTDAVVVHGDLEIRLDKAGLRQAEALAALFAAARDELASRNLPELADERPQDGDVVDNPLDR